MISSAALARSKARSGSTQQIKTVHKDLLAFQAKTEQKLDKLDGRLDKVDGRLDRVDSGLRGLRDAMPGIVGDAMRATPRERPGKSRKTP